MHSSHLAVVICARRGAISYDSSFERLPSQLARNFSGNNLVVLYPEQYAYEGGFVSFSDPQGHNESQHYNRAREWVTDLFKMDDLPDSEKKQDKQN